MSSVTELPDEEILKIAQELRVAYKLKRTLRYSTERDFSVHSESVAEHIFSLIYLAQYFLQHEPLGPSLNAEKVHRILLFHDFGEIKHGDVPYHQKTKEHEEQERQAAKEIFASLPSSLHELGYASWQEYENRQTPEGRFAYALDKLEPLFELLDPVNERSMKRLRFTLKMNIDRKLKATEDFPVMRRFVNAITNDMVARNVFWEE